IPELTDYGVGIGDQHLIPPTHRVTFEQARASLLNGAEACTRVCDWLARLERTIAINTRVSSYGLKHLAEPTIGYVTNGECNAAAVPCGFPYRLVPGSLNVWFGVSARSVRKISAE